MNKYLLSLLFFGFALSVTAQINGSGYYRVKNIHGNRYTVVADNQSDGANVQTSDADLTAVRLRQGHDQAIFDPGTVIYLDSKGDNKYDITAQGTGVYKMIGRYPEVYKVSDNIYYVYATISGMAQYLSDKEDDPDEEYGILDLGGSGNRRKWSVYPISATGDEYFGLKPSVTAGGKNYAPFYAAFPFSFASSGMKAYYIKMVDNAMGVAVLSEITSTVIPASTPIFVECAGAQPTDNRLNLLTGSYSAPQDNKLNGCYFNYPFKRNVSRDAVTYNNPSTMRVLAALEDGSLGFVSKTTSQLKYMPANQSWLTVTSDAPAQLKVVTEEEYLALDLGTVRSDDAAVTGIYSLAGVLLSKDLLDLSRMPKGIYIVNGRKVVKM